MELGQWCCDVDIGKHLRAVRDPDSRNYDRRGGTASMSNTPNCGPTAGVSDEPDPIFASIERHRAAARGWLAAYDRLGEKWDDCIDAPERIEANTAFLAANEELDKALEAVLSTSPTTIVGVAELFDYIGRYRCQPLAPILNCAFLPMIAATLPRGASGELDPIFASIERHRAALRGWLVARVTRTEGTVSSA
jgi:hypothetical protein